MEKDFGNKLTIPQNEIGKISKRGYVMSQFARFIRPGAVRVGATMKPEANVFASAYKSAGEDSLIVVLLNRDYTNSKTVTISVPGISKLESFHVYTTSETKNAKDEGFVDVVNGSVTIKMESGTNNKDCIVTLVGEIGEVVKTPRQPYNEDAAQIPGKIEAEEFDIPGTGRENKTYSDADSENHACTDEGKEAECNDLREGTGIDIYKKATGYIVGHNQAGEWLEYTVNVKETGYYTMFASVASDNATSSFQLSIDGDELTDEIEVPKNSSYDDYSFVKEEVHLTRGEHILRFTVTGSWMDIDYFTFVRGKGATDPDAYEEDDEDDDDDDDDDDIGMPTLAAARLSVTESESYRVFDMNGGYIGNVRAAGMQELHDRTANLVRNSGLYLVRSSSGKTLKVNVK